MKRWIICLAAALAALTVFSRAAELPAELTDALPEGTEDLIAATDLTASGGLAQGRKQVYGAIHAADCRPVLSG